jgi:shikimate dehydrogenase
MKVFGLIGWPLKNSFSENYFNSKFLSLALLDHSYQNFPIENIKELPDLLLENPELKGLNITIPHKETIIPYLDELDESAREAGAVNCITITDNKQQTENIIPIVHREKTTNRKLTGYNTDVYGFETSLLPVIEGRNITAALILGTGGAAKAVAYVLRKNNISYRFVSRKASENRLSYEELTGDIITSHRLIINCTPLGMFPDTETAPDIPYQYISPEHIAYDLIYLPIETLFLKHCREQGATAKNGLEMLHLQAEKSWKIWKNS